MTYEAMQYVAHANAQNLGIATKDGSPVPDDIQMVLEEYGHSFAPPQEWCLGCGATLSDEFGLGAFQWGLAHGEGQCMKCGYPYRAYHRIPHIGRLNMILGYHPSCVSMEQVKENLDVLNICEPNVPDVFARAMMRARKAG